VVCYSNESKIRILKVPEEVIRDHGAVSPECAEAMALGAKELLGSDFALSVTGIAGPDGGTEEKPVGTVCFAISSPKGLETFQRQFFGDRSNIRDWAVAFGLEKLWRAIKGGCEGGAR
jgi:PncC family amidohydrolase